MHGGVDFEKNLPSHTKLYHRSQRPKCYRTPVGRTPDRRHEVNPKGVMARKQDHPHDRATLIRSRVHNQARTETLT